MSVEDNQYTGTIPTEFGQLVAAFGRPTADKSGNSDVLLTFLDQPKLGGNMEAVRLGGDHVARLMKHYGSLQDDSVFESHASSPQLALSLMGSGQAVAVSVAAAVVTFLRPMSISAALQLGDGRSRAASVVRHRSTLDSVRRAFDKAHALAKKWTSRRATAAILVLSMYGHDGVMGATLPTTLPTSTISIDYNQQGLTGTIPTQVRSGIHDGV